MRKHDQAEHAWEDRLLNHLQRGSSGGFAIGFLIGAGITGAAFFWLGSAGVEHFPRVLDTF